MTRAAGRPRRPAPSRPEAIEAIRRLAAEGVITIQRNAQKGMDRLEHDATDALALLAGCELHECEEGQPSDWSEDYHVYVFRIELEDDLPLYVKVSLNVASLATAELLSYKLYGSPE